MIDLSVYVIAKNEGKSLRNVLNHFKKLGAEIIVGVDKSSEDSTILIGKEMADVFFIFDWNELGFAGSRNLAISYCTRRWIFQVDGHEYLDFNSHKYLPSLISSSEEFVAVNIKINLIGSRGWKPIYSFYFPRLFRNHMGIHYNGWVHASLTGLEKARVVFCSEIVLRHKRTRRLALKRHKQRVVENIPYFEGKTDNREQPDHKRSLFYLGCIYQEQGNSKRAIQSYKEYLEISEYGEERYQAGLELAQCLIKSGENRVGEVEEILYGTGCDNWCRNEHLILLGDIYFAKEEYIKALHFYRLASQYDEPQSFFPYTVDCYKGIPFEKMSQTLAVLGRIDEAIKVARKVLRFRRDKEALSIMKKLLDYRQLVN